MSIVVLPADLCCCVISRLSRLPALLPTVDAKQEESRQLARKSFAMQLLAAKHNYLIMIIAALRDHGEDKKLFGLVVDRVMLSRIFGGFATVLYLVLKQFADHVILGVQSYAPPGFGGKSIYTHVCHCIIGAVTSYTVPM